VRTQFPLTLDSTSPVNHNTNHNTTSQSTPTVLEIQDQIIHHPQPIRMPQPPTPSRHVQPRYACSNPHTTTSYHNLDLEYGDDGGVDGRYDGGCCDEGYERDTGGGDGRWEDGWGEEEEEGQEVMDRSLQGRVGIGCIGRA
jgi:hypothetical protein